MQLHMPIHCLRSFGARDIAWSSQDWWIPFRIGHRCDLQFRCARITMSRRWKNSKNRLPNQGLREPCYFFPEDWPATARRCISIWHVWHVFLINHLAWRTVTHFVFPGDSASLQIHCSFSTVVQHWRQKLGQNIFRLKRIDLLQSLSHKTCSLDARHALVQKLNRNEQKKHDSQQDGFFVL